MISLASTKKERLPLPNTLHTLLEGNSHDPHHLLGLQPGPTGHKVIRLYRPGADSLFVMIRGQAVQMTKVHDAGVFEVIVSGNVTFQDYKVYHANGLLGYDPYAITPSFGELDQHLFASGCHYELYRVMGATVTIHQGVTGVRFALWAPNAVSVALVGDFNHWDGRVNAMRSLGVCGVWELFIPALSEGQKYKFEVHTKEGDLLLKSDPYGKAFEMRPKTGAVVADVDAFDWDDHAWIRRREERRDQAQPMNVYEVHLGSWRKREGFHWFSYAELADQLVDYCKKMAFTHVELMPVMEHPYDPSWGYQVTGFYGVTSRFGTPRDFQAFVNTLHMNGIGVILDWVPAHFPRDDFSLSEFDGTALYEHADPKQSDHPHWGTLIFNYGRPEVSNFLIANALYWFDKMHIDGLRVDAVASMLYLDYGREEGEWIPNKHGGNESLEAIEFLKHLNSVVHERYPGVLTIAEESTSFPGITTSVNDGGIGFDLKWNMGWMNDTLRYFERDAVHRSHHQNELTFGLLYAFSEKFTLVLSHDEVVHGKKSLLSKMPGDMWQQFANLRLLLTYQACQPGKNLIFMGTEIGQWNEWDAAAEIEWLLLHFPSHRGIQLLVSDINRFVLDHSQLWERDFSPEGFEWVDFSDHGNSVISYRRKSTAGELLCVHNFTPNYYSDYNIYLSNVTEAKQLFSSDDPRYGGSGKYGGQIDVLKGPWGNPIGLKTELPPLSTTIFDLTFHVQ